MKTNHIFEQELLQGNTTSYKVAKQLVIAARKNSPSDGYGVEVLAKKLAAQYYKDILYNIDLELKMQKANRI